MQATKHPLESMLRKLQLWKALDPAEQKGVLGLPSKVEHRRAGEYIVRDGQKATHSCLLMSGFAFRSKVVADGSRSISAIHMRGDIVDLQNSLLGIADHNVQTLTECSVAFIPRQKILTLAFEYPNVGMAMWYDTLVDGSIFREWIANNARRDARARIAHLLCEFGVRLEAATLGSKLDFQLPITQEQLADCTGLTPVHVNRTLQDLQASGEIKRSMRHVEVIDWAKISQTADFDQAYLHLPTDGGAPAQQ